MTATLTGEFYVGQYVRIDDEGYVGAHWQRREGIVHVIDAVDPGGSPWILGINFGEHSDSEVIYFEKRSVKPL